MVKILFADPLHEPLGMCAHAALAIKRRVGRAMPGQINGNHRVVWDEGKGIEPPAEGAAQEAVDEKQWRARAGLSDMQGLSGDFHCFWAT